LAALAAALAACGGGGDGDDGAQLDDLAFARHLRLATDALLRQLPGAAKAELDRCAEARPEDPEVFFQRARLAMLPGAEDEAAARSLLAEVLERAPGHVSAHRALFLLDARRGDAAAAAGHRLAVEAALGLLGSLELARALESESTARTPVLANFPAVPTAGPGIEDYAALVDGFLALERTGSYDPERSVREAEAVLARLPELAALRHQYAYALDSQEVRIQNTGDHGLPVISSKVTLDLARKHFERAYERSLPSSGIATASLRALSEVALKLGEWEEAFQLKELAQKDARITPPELLVLRMRQGLARYKQGRFDDATAIYRDAIERSQGAPLRIFWLADVAQEAAGIPEEARAPRFPFRPDLALLAPGAERAFADVAKALGVDRYDGLGPTAWGDFDHDGDDDLFTCGCDSYGALLRDDGRRFTDVSREVGLEHVQSGYSATLADADGDGWLDVYVGRDGWSGPAPNGLYRNRSGHFEDVTEKAGVGDRGSTFVHLWSDFDRDGDLDLYMANGITGAGDVNALYRNEGDGTFEHATRAAGLEEARGTKTIGVAAGDYDDDGLADIFCSGYLTANRLYHNEGGGRFTERARAAGVEGAGHVSTGYVAFFADVDGDLDLDILRTSLAPFDQVIAGMSSLADAAQRKEMLKNAPKLYRNQGAGSFSEDGVAMGLVHPFGVMGAGVADLDNDGWLDVYLGTGDPDLGRLEPDRYLHNEGGAAFTDQTFALGLGNLGKGHGVTFLDRDRDGDLDIYAQEGGFVMGDAWSNAFYENRSHATGNHWLHVLLEGVASNPEGIDAKVLVTAGGRTLLRERRNGEGFGSSNSPALEFGLGGATAVERVEIRWPSGAVQTFDDAPLDARIFVREGEKWVER
jgi:tetratricopeptide (TPR) repeat protein